MRLVHRKPLSLLAQLLVTLPLSAASSHESIRLASTPNRGAERRAITEFDMARRREFLPLGSGLSGAVFSVAPNGKHVVFQLLEPDPIRDKFSVSWYAVSVDQNDPHVNLGDAGDVILRTDDSGFIHGERIGLGPPKWTMDSASIVYRKRENGEVQLWRSRLKDGFHEQLTHNASDVREFFLSADGTWICYTVDAASRASLKASRAAEAKRGYLVDSRFVPVYDLRSLRSRPPEGQLWVFDLVSRIDRLATAEERKCMEAGRESEAVGSNSIAQAQPRDPAIGAAFRSRWKTRPDVVEPTVLPGDPPKIAFADVLQPEDRMFAPSAILKVATGAGSKTVIECTAAPCRGMFRRLWWESDGSAVIFQPMSINLETAGIYRWSLASGAVQEILATNALDRCEKAPGHLMCVYSAPDQPGILVALDLKSGKVSPRFDPNPELRNIAYTDTERLTWRNDVGDEAFGYLLYPAGYRPGTRYPLAILTYRAQGFLDTSTGGEYPAQVLAARGIMVLVFNRPFSVAYKEGDVESDNDSRNVQDFLERAIRSLEERELIDPTRVAITGLSDGATITFRAIAGGRRSFAAAIVSTTPEDPLMYWLGGPSVREFLRRQKGVFVAQGQVHAPFFDQYAPALNVDRIQTPLLLNLPASEALTAMPTIVSLQDAHKPVEAFVFPSEYHEKWGAAHRYNIYRRNVQWLLFWLLGKSVDDPVDEQQYDRWRSLRRQLRDSQMARDGGPG